MLECLNVVIEYWILNLIMSCRPMLVHHNLLNMCHYEGCDPQQCLKGGVMGIYSKLRFWYLVRPKITIHLNRLGQI